MAGERGSQHRYGERGPGGLAKPHVEFIGEISDAQKPHVQLGTEPAMAGLCRAMGDLGMVEAALAQKRKRRRGRRGDEAVKQHGNAVAAGCKRGTKNCCELTTTEDHACKQ